ELQKRNCPTESRTACNRALQYCRRLEDIFDAVRDVAVREGVAFFLSFHSLEKRCFLRQAKNIQVVDVESFYADGDEKDVLVGIDHASELYFVVNVLDGGTHLLQDDHFLVGKLQLLGQVVYP